MDEAEHRRKPWKTRCQNVLGTFHADGAGAKTTTEELRECFESLAERGKLCPYDILVCHYLLYADDWEAARIMLSRLILTTDRSERVETHNWLMHSLMTATQREGRGEVIQSLKYPLFPPRAPQRLNDEALAAAPSRRERCFQGGHPSHSSQWPRPGVRLSHTLPRCKPLPP